MRLAEAGPWWDHTLRPALHRTAQEEAELTDHETFLADRDDRARLQAHARTQLTAEHQPSTGSPSPAEPAASPRAPPTQ